VRHGHRVIDIRPDRLTPAAYAPSRDAANARRTRGGHPVTRRRETPRPRPVVRRAFPDDGAHRQPQDRDRALLRREARFGGAAEAAGTTLGGAIDQLKNSFSDLFELGARESGVLISSLRDITDILRSGEMKTAVGTLAEFFVSQIRSMSKEVLDLVRLLNQLKNLDISGILNDVKQQATPRAPGFPSPLFAGGTVQSYFEGRGATVPRQAEFNVGNIARQMDRYSAIGQEAAASVTDGQEKGLF
jgi:hypothetical protein